MAALRCLKATAGPASMAGTLLRPSISTIRAQPTISSSTRYISLLSPRRPMLPTSSAPACMPTPGVTTAPSLAPAGALDLASKISAHPALGSIQIRCGPRATYNPSHLVRKRRHGFLSRIRTKNGRKTLMRRIKKGRWNLSH